MGESNGNQVSMQMMGIDNAQYGDQHSNHVAMLVPNFTNTAMSEGSLFMLVQGTDGTQHIGHIFFWQARFGAFPPATLLTSGCLGGRICSGATLLCFIWFLRSRTGCPFHF